MRRRKKAGALEKYLSYKNLIIEYGDLTSEDGIKSTASEVLEFVNGKELEIELGSGCSGFSLSLARTFKNKRFIAFDFKEELLLKAVEIAENENLENLRFVRGRIEDICFLFPKPIVSKIYLNFSDPWPKARHAKRRLTHRNFLKLYSKILKEHGIFEFKTDHDGMYEFTLEEFKDAGFIIEKNTDDLHSEEKNILMTEYEKKYIEQGKKIKYIKAGLDSRFLKG